MEDGGLEPGSSDFGVLLRRYRLDAGLSQGALAERARLSLDGISALERGHRRTPRRETLALLANALALSDEQRRAFESAAARAASPRRRGETSVTVGPWPSVGTASLPLALTRFVGREIELDEIAALVREHRLVTLTGAGGIGKTQTALQVATALRDSADSVACFVELAPIRDPSLVTTAVALALGVQEVPHHSLLETLTAYLKNKSLLLILDNCEHVIAEAANVAAALMQNCPRVRILATSRETLRDSGERAYRIPSLSANDAIALFTDRAKAADAHFALTDKNETLVADICRRLDGIPLAIELAAARVNVLPLKGLVEKLEDRLGILTGGERMALPKQQTMRAAIDWSYDLLSPQEQRLLDRLSVFAGGCELAAAAAVCSSEETPEAKVFDVLSSLVDKSLVIADFEGMEPRYRLLESFRAYAREKLAERDELETVARRHARVYLEIANQVNAARETGADSVWRERARRELDNWRAALEWALAARGDVELGQRLAGELWLLWTGYAPVEGRRWLALALDLADKETGTRTLASINCASAAVANVLAEAEMERTSSEKALGLYRDVGDAFGIARSQVYLANALKNLGRSKEAEPIVLEALARLRELGSRNHLGYALRVTSQVCLGNGDFTTARGHLAEALAIYNATGAYRYAAQAVATDFAEVELNAGNAELAFRRALDVLPALRAYKDNTLVYALPTVSACCISMADYDGAESYAREAVIFSSELHLTTHVARALQKLAVVAILRAQRDPERRAEPCARAGRLFGFIDAHLAALGSPRDFLDRQEYERASVLLCSVVGPEQFASLMNEGAQMSQEQAIDEALGAGI
ncbi:MAG: helix-turn-helix domain-containing protein [Candidatus Cybelea sp.]